MSTFDEQTRALVWAGGFLIEVARDESLPLAVRQKAVKIARHFPTLDEVLLGAKFNRSQSPATARQDLIAAEEQSWIRDCAAGPLTNSTRLKWPE